MQESWGWAGSAGEFLSTPIELWIESLRQHHLRLMGQGISEHQRLAWTTEHEVMANALRECITADPGATGWSVIFEYELPLEGGRRPDVVVLSGRSISVLEFKSTERPTQPQVDQVGAYARDISDYHEESHGIPVQSILVLPAAATDFALEVDGTAVTGPGSVSPYLLNHSASGQIELKRWLESAYLPLPTLVAAARRIFEHEPLPHVKKAVSAGIPLAIELLEKLAERARTEGDRVVAFVTGVPGAGKTLVGLRFVYEQSSTQDLAIFLSGNGPLVRVLQDALRSKVFVRDLHRFIQTYGINEKPPTHHIVVFDEAQRAWDRGFMNEKKHVDRSEPDLLIDVGKRIDDWSALVGLVGEGQEIFSGEEGGMQQWREAIAQHSDTSWKIHCAPHLRDVFAGLEVETHEHLHLSAAVRARRADDIHDWVRLLLAGSLPLAARKAMRFSGDEFQMYVTRDLQDAKNYALGRYLGEPDARYGLVASSHTKTPEKYGLDNSFLATRKIKEGRWFNAEQDDPDSCCALTQPVTEFQCQGLELDLPVVCWGEDMLWDGRAWKLKPKRRQYQLRDPEQILQNAYRVLLTRGRDGMVMWLPSEETFDFTEHALLAAGVRPLPESLELEDDGLARNGA